MNTFSSRLWDSLMCLDYFSFKALNFKVYSSNQKVEILLNPNFIKILTQVINKISRIQKNKKSFNLCQNHLDTTIYNDFLIENNENKFTNSKVVFSTNQCLFIILTLLYALSQHMGKCVGHLICPINYKNGFFIIGFFRKGTSFRDLKMYLKKLYPLEPLRLLMHLGQ